MSKVNGSAEMIWDGGEIRVQRRKGETAIETRVFGEAEYAEAVNLFALFVTKAGGKVTRTDANSSSDRHLVRAVGLLVECTNDDIDEERRDEICSFVDEVTGSGA